MMAEQSSFPNTQVVGGGGTNLTPSPDRQVGSQMRLVGVGRRPSHDRARFSSLSILGNIISVQYFAGADPADLRSDGSEGAGAPDLCTALLAGAVSMILLANAMLILVAMVTSSREW